jgi:hypothetical protein
MKRLSRKKIIRVLTNQIFPSFVVVGINLKQVLRFKGTWGINIKIEIREVLHTL